MCCQPLHLVESACCSVRKYFAVVRKTWGEFLGSTRCTLCFFYHSVGAEGLLGGDVVLQHSSRGSYLDGWCKDDFFVEVFYFIFL